MKPLAWMAGLSVGSWLALTAVRSDANPEALLGMLGPLLAAGASWVAVERMHAAAPERVMSVMLTAFMAKMMFFGVFVAAMLRGLELRRTPFVVSFTVYFIALYAMEALFLKRLFDSGRQRSP
jgi:xanthosine utilization system XapX-like protein